MIADDFTDTDGVQLTTHAPFTNLPSYPSALTSNFVIKSNALAANLAGEYVAARYSGVSFNNDQLSRGTLTTVGPGSASAIGVGVRNATNGSCSGYLYYGHVTASNTYKMVNGVAFVLGGHSAFVSGDDIEISSIGTTVTSKKNGVTMFTGTDVSLSSGSPGVWGFATAADTLLGEWSCTGEIIVTKIMAHIRDSRLTDVPGNREFSIEWTLSVRGEVNGTVALVQDCSTLSDDDITIALRVSLAAFVSIATGQPFTAADVSGLRYG